MCTQVRVDFYVFICIICIICIFLVNNKTNNKDKNHKNTFVLVETKSLMLRLHALSSELAHRHQAKTAAQKLEELRHRKRVFLVFVK